LQQSLVFHFFRALTKLLEMCDSRGPCDFHATSIPLPNASSARGLFFGVCCPPERGQSVISPRYKFIFVYTHRLNCCNRGQPPRAHIINAEMFAACIFLFTNSLRCLLCECKKVSWMCADHICHWYARHKNWFERKIKGRTWLCARSFTPCMWVELVWIVPSGRAAAAGQLWSPVSLAFAASRQRDEKVSQCLVTYRLCNQTKWWLH